MKEAAAKVKGYLRDIRMDIFEIGTLVDANGFEHVLSHVKQLQRHATSLERLTAEIIAKGDKK